MPSSLQYWSAEAGPGGIFENLALSVVDMRGDLWVVTGLFGTVCNGFRRVYARDSRAPCGPARPSLPAPLSLPQRSHYEILNNELEC